MTETELLQCPWSATHTVRVGRAGTNAYGYIYYPRCDDCMFSLPTCHTKEEAIEKWNTRADSALKADNASIRSANRALLEVVDELRTALASARNNALEEAALCAESRVVHGLMCPAFRLKIDELCECDADREVETVDRIRALKRPSAAERCERTGKGEV